jgi:hypothetical protein
VTVADVLDRVKSIERRASEGRPDFSALHGDEDQLFVDVLRAISGGAELPADLAHAALKSLEIAFERWCA